MQILFTALIQLLMCIAACILLYGSHISATATCSTTDIERLNNISASDILSAGIGLLLVKRLWVLHVGI